LKSSAKITIKTTQGEIEIARDYYYCRRCKNSEIPLDARLGINESSYKMTKGMLLEVAYWGQNQPSFEAAKEIIQKVHGMYVNGETIRQITEELGRLVHEADAQRAALCLEHMDKIDLIDDAKRQSGVLYIMTDGAAVNTRAQDENGSTWRENKLVLAFTDKDMIRRIDGGYIIVKKQYSALIGSAEQFKGFVLDTALKAGYGKIKEVVVIADGATWIRNMCNEIFPDATQILDLYHLKENIFTYAKDKFRHDEKQYTPYAKRLITLIEKGHVDEALDEIKNDTHSSSVNLKTYIENNKTKINYPLYKSKNYFVGSGAIESGNKIILHRRLKQPGMRWSIKGAQAILTLRCKAEGGLWQSEVVDRLCA